MILIIYFLNGFHQMHNFLKGYSAAFGIFYEYKNWIRKFMYLWSSRILSRMHNLLTVVIKQL